jgi:hypothetical protein
MAIKFKRQPFQKRDHNDNIKDKQDLPQRIHLFGTPSALAIFGNGSFSGPSLLRRVVWLRRIIEILIQYDIRANLNHGSGNP